MLFLVYFPCGLPILPCRPPTTIAAAPRIARPLRVVPMPRAVVLVLSALVLVLALGAALLPRTAPTVPDALLAVLHSSIVARARVLAAAHCPPPATLWARADADARAYGAAVRHVLGEYSAAALPAARWATSASARLRHAALHGPAHPRVAQLYRAAAAHVRQLSHQVAQRVVPILDVSAPPPPAASDHLLHARAHAGQHWPVYVVPAAVLLAAVGIFAASRARSPAATFTPAAVDAPGDASVDIPSRYQLHHHTSSPDTTLAEDEGAPAPHGADPIASTPIKAKDGASIGHLNGTGDGNGLANTAKVAANGSAASSNGAPVVGVEERGARPPAAEHTDKPLPAQPQKHDASATAATSAPATPAKSPQPPSAYKKPSSRDDGDSKSILQRSGTSMRKLRRSLRRTSGEVFGRSRTSLSPGSTPEHGRVGDDSFDASTDTPSASPLRKGRGRRISALILGDRKIR